MELFDLTGKVAIVTGGNCGIGLGIAEGLIAAGASVVISGRDAAKGEAAAGSLGARAAFVAADVTRKGDCAALVAASVARFGQLDILVNNAGIAIRRPPHEFEEAEWHKVMDTNMTGTFLCCQAAHPEMVRMGGGKIINIGSMMSLFGAPYAAAYAASKGAVVQYTRAIATAWAADNIQANAILPGWIDTELTSNARKQVSNLHETVLARTPAGRWGQPDDLAGIGIFLASAASDFVTGTAIPCDGGYSIRA